MNQKRKKKQQQQKSESREPIKKEPLNQAILDSIGSANPWTPEVENTWIKELNKLSSSEIYKRFPPMKKPPNARKRGKTNGWNSNTNS